jgi:hypothetical protein
MRNASHEIDLPPIVAIEDDESEETQPSSSRQSPALAPLDVLQQTRSRGSITDPALHAIANKSPGKAESHCTRRSEEEEELRANGGMCVVFAVPTLRFVRKSQLFCFCFVPNPYKHR